jgi:exoribonuclease-2
MNLLFEDEGDLKVGAVLSSTEASFQVELPGGRRAKIKAGHVLLRFERPAGAQLLEQARREADAIDLDFLWQCAPQQEFGFEQLARDYFGREPAAVEAATILVRLHSAPVYFHRKGKGRFRPAAPDVLRAALAAVARRREQDELRAQYVAELMAGGLPEAIRRQGAQLLLRPDRNAPEHKAVEQAAREQKTTALRLLLARGSIASPYAWHLESFMARCFPHGPDFPSRAAPAPPDGALPLSTVAAFSIDDTSTTEIDDAFSVSSTPDGRIRIGIHIAAPATAIARDDPLDALARSRMSTVYAPGLKITMLPEPWIAAFSLNQGRTVPALSLYLDLDQDGLRVESAVSVLERIRIVANLRHDELGPLVTQQTLAGSASAEVPFGTELAALWRLANALLRARETSRGRPEPSGRVDYSFELQGEGEQALVSIRPRLRDAPLDRIVSELMIYANSHWGAWLAERGVAGVYRSQSAGRVRMSTAPAPHDGIGVSHYAWSTSPLRRYVDLVNQRQLVAVVREREPAYGRSDAQLFAIVSAFDSAYGAYDDFQRMMERYWCLRWLDQNAVRRHCATVLRGDLVRLDGLPLVARVPGMPPLARGRCVELELLGHDLLDLSLEARLHRVLDASSQQEFDEDDAALDPARFAAAEAAIAVAMPAPSDSQDGVAETTV